MISRVLAADLPRHVGEHVHDRRLAASPPGAEVRDVPDRPGPLRPGPGRPAAVRPAGGGPPACPRKPSSRSTGVVTASAQAPGGAELTEPVVTPLSGPAAPPPFDLYRPSLTAGLPTILDDAPTTLRHPVLRAGFEIAAASVAGLPRRRSTPWASPRSTRRRSSSRPPSRARTCSASTTSAGPPTWPSRRSSTSRRMVGVFERVYEVGPVFRAEPHDTARHLAQYTSLDAELGFISDHRDVMAVLRDAVAGHGGRRCGSGRGPPVELLGAGAAGGAAADPGHPLRRRAGADRRRRPAGTRAASRTCRPPTSGGWASGRSASTAASSCS